MTTNSRQEIMRSLNELDTLQSERVLEYIKAIMRQEQHVPKHHRVKRKALKEIRSALREPKHSF